MTISVPDRPTVAERRRLFVELQRSACWPRAVPEAVLMLEAEPLASAGFFAGDLLRQLMEVAPAFWGCHPGLYERYRALIRAAAIERSRLTPHAQMEFWSELPVITPSSGDTPWPGGVYPREEGV